MTGGGLEPPGLAPARSSRPGHPGAATLPPARSRTPPTATSPTTRPPAAPPRPAPRISPPRRPRRTGPSGAAQTERDRPRGTGWSNWLRHVNSRVSNAG